MPQIERTSKLPAPVGEAFAWHERPGALIRLSPPFLPARVERPAPSLEPGSEAWLRLPVGPLRGPLAPRWRARHTVRRPPEDQEEGAGEFVDVQVAGPFASWEHRHRLQAAGPDECVLTDDIRYALPLGRVGEAVAGRGVRRRVGRMLSYRHRVTVEDLAVHAHARQKGGKPMHVAVTGSTGLIGEALVAFLSTGGHQVTRVSRRASEDAIVWDPENGRLDPEQLRGVDAVVHLAGEPIAARRWSDEQKRRILESRTEGTRLLADSIAELGDEAPSVLVSASGINYYGDGGDDVLTEDSPPGDDFLAEVCVAWEAATRPAEDAGVRVVHMRTGIVQTPQGGALARQLPLFKAGIGGKLGHGRQWMSWVSLDDVIGLYHHALTTPEVRGPLNAVAPSPVTNAEYAKTLARVLRRPALLPVPKLGPKLVFGEMAEALLFPSLRILPTVAERTGYRFRHPRLEPALREVLGKAAA